MLSICIGIYNWNVSSLVNALHQQATSLAINFEIILIDDASSIRWEENEQLRNLPYVIWIQNDKNMGRSAIRNRLAAKAQFHYLLFMDCDTEVKSTTYLHDYLSRLDQAEVISGGYAYPDVKPARPYILRWYYGKKVEEQDAQKRSINPNFSFSTFNFLIKKKLFEKIEFDESLTTYGHEDTLFGWELQQRGVTVKHIDNPLLHKVKVESSHYIGQTEEAIQNLLKIFFQIENREKWLESVALLRFVQKIETLHLLLPFLALFRVTKSLQRKILLSQHPSLWLFNFYKAGTLCQILRQQSLSLISTQKTLKR